MTDFHSTGLQSLLEAMDACGASDLHLKAGCSPGMRVDGHLVPVEGVAPLSSQALDGLIGAMTTQEQRAELLLTGDLEFAFTGAGASRYRVSLARQRGQTGAVLRRIPVEVPNIDQLGLPAAAKKLCQLQRGLVLVTGATGSGKSTTLAAMVDFINRECGGHIMTMEDPIEFVHADQACYVTQREIGVDCDSFELALRRALRHDPDVIMIDELRDRETISLALTAAETGHLVLATAHTPGAVQTVDRMLDAFPIDQHAEMRGRFATVLQGVVSQTLLPRIGGGRIAALEILVATDAIKSCVRDGKSSQIHIQIQSGGQFGMQTQASALAELVFTSMITEETALQFAVNQEELKNQLAHGASHLRASARPAAVPTAPAAAPPRAAAPTAALPPWAVAALAPPAAPKGRAPLSSPIDPMPAQNPGHGPGHGSGHAAGTGAPAAPAYTPRNAAGVAELLEKLRRS